MLTSRKDVERSLLLMLFVGLLASTIFPLFGQTVGSDIQVNPPIHAKGNAQPVVVGLTPSQVRHAYGFDLISNQGAGQTIGIIEAFNDANIEDDLATFSQQFGLSPCTTSNGCFRKMFSSNNNPSTKAIWSLETALDVEWAHAMAPDAHILLVEAPSNVLSDLLDAVDFAVVHGATVISMSWGGLEFLGEDVLDTHFVKTNVSFVASSGDSGTGVLYPAASPYVTAVGGTTLNIASDGKYLGETAWAGSGGGLSIAELEPLYQLQFKIPNDPAGFRGNPDVAYNADPNTGFAVYTTQPFQGFKGWIQVGGTSAGAPQWSALLAIANSMRDANHKSLLTGSNAALYNAAAKKASYNANYHDITSGSNDLNGTCGVLCDATVGYDYVTGLGSPQANNLISALAKAP